MIFLISVNNQAKGLVIFMEEFMCRVQSVEDIKRLINQLPEGTLLEIELSDQNELSGKSIERQGENNDDQSI